MFLMALSASNIVKAEDSTLVATPEVSSQVQDEQQGQIKGNKDSFDKAVESMDNKDYQSAIVYLSAYITSKPKKYEAYKLRGDCFYALRQFVLAQNDYQTAIDLKASDDKFLTGTKVLGAVVLGADKQEQLQNPELGNLYAKLMYAQKALNNPAYETSYSKAVEYNSHIYLPQPKKSDIALINCPQKYGKVLNPKGADEYLYGAIDDIENSHFNEAIYKAQYLTSNYPKYYLGHYLVGVSMVGLEQENEAVDSFKNSLKYNPYDFESLASLGQIYYDKAEKTFSPDYAKKSIDYFKQALKYNPNCYLYYYYLGLNEMQLGNNDLAIINFNKAIKFNINDYNSRYYKAIAQYIKGDYNSVVDDCTKLLYRHVSNYNSVLYLRALAQYKLGDKEKAIADLEKIQSGVEDIYNADVRIISAKEKTLQNYLYYLKSKLLQDEGYGVKADLMKALQNPIIAKLNQIENVASSYKSSMNGEIISLNDYKNFENFYKNRLPQLLQQGGLTISLDDIDNQFDYIRTTFDDLGINFVYSNPDYKMTTTEDYVYKKYSSKLTNEDRQTVLAQIPNVKTEPLVQVKPLLKATTSQMDMLPSDSQTSIAQILASQSLGAVITAAFDNNSVQQPKEDVVALQPKPAISTELPPEVSEILNEDKQVIKTEEKKDEKHDEAQLHSDSLVIARQDSIIDGTSEVTTPKDDSQEATMPDFPIDKEFSVDPKITPTKVVADEIKRTQDFTVSYPKEETVKVEKPIEQQPVIETPKPVATPEVEKTEPIMVTAQDVTTKVADSMEQPAKQVEEVKKSEPVKIVEKHADINPKDFDLVHNQAPKIAETDEVIELAPENYMSDVEKVLSNQQFGNINNQKVANNFSGLKISSKVDDVAQTSEKVANGVKEQVEETKTAEVSKIAEVKDEAQIVLPEENNSAKKDEKAVSVPVVTVPHLEAPKTEKPAVTTVASKTDETVSEQQERPTLALRPQAQIDEVEEQVDEIETSEVKNDDVTVEKFVESQKAVTKAEKEKGKADKKAAIEQFKQQKQEAKVEAKAKLQQEKALKLKAKEDMKAAEVLAKEADKQAKLEEKKAKLDKIAQLKAQKDADKNAKIEAKKARKAKKLEELAQLKQEKLKAKQATLEAKKAAQEAKAQEKAQALADRKRLLEDRAKAKAEFKARKVEEKLAKKQEAKELKQQSLEAKKIQSTEKAEQIKSVKLQKVQDKKAKVEEQKEKVNLGESVEVDDSALKNFKPVKENKFKKLFKRIPKQKDKDTELYENKSSETTIQPIKIKKEKVKKEKKVKVEKEKKSIFSWFKKKEKSSKPVEHNKTVIKSLNKE